MLSQMTNPTPRPWHVLLAMGDQRETVEPMARDRTHAISSALELAGATPGTIVVLCHEIGDW
jgi:hypothetical protein